MQRPALAAACGAALLLVVPVAAQTADADWKRNGVCYEVFVRSFYDSNGDGIGDLNGLTEKLDYINDGSQASQSDLGANCIWLMPVASSPSYHGYDVTDYYRINPDYGTNDDFKRFVSEAHERGIHVLVDMVLNHSSSEHPYFKHALLHADSPYRDWYLWSPRPGPKNEWGGENWHRSPVREEYYYGFFWSGMPDLNVENPEVIEETKRIAAFWLNEMGVDGFRLDAIRHLVEDGERTANVPGTHVFLRDYAAHIREIAPAAFTIGEVWDSTSVLMAYYPDQLDAHFAFEVSDSILSAVRNGSAEGLLHPVLRLQGELPPDRWSPFLRNHDQTRTVTALGGDPDRARVAASLLLTLPGLPFVYYGEELGMTGDKPDPRLRTPMHWTRTRAGGFTEGTPWEPLQPDSFSANVEALEGDDALLLHHYRRLIHLRSARPVLGPGELVPLVASERSVAAYLRRLENDAVLVVVNLGSETLAGVSLNSEPGALSAGRYSLTGLLNGQSAAGLRIEADGRIRDYVPFTELAPMQTHVLAISR